MLESLFSSRVRAKVLAAFFLQPGEKHNAWALSRILKENYSAVWKELAHLEKLGILTSEQSGNSKNYQENKICPINPELRGIVLKTEGAGRILREKLATFEGIKEAFIYGSYASGDADANSDIDLMIIGNISLEHISLSITIVERLLNRPVNYVIYSEKEWNEKAAVNDPFWENISMSPKIMLIGGDHAL